MDRTDRASSTDAAAQADAQAAGQSSSPGTEAGWTVADLQRQAAEIWAQANAHLAGLPDTPGPAAANAPGQDAFKPGAGDPEATARAADPDSLAAGANSLFGAMVDMQSRHARESADALLARVWSIYGLARPAAADGPASAPRSHPTGTSAGSTQKET